MEGTAKKPVKRQERDLNVTDDAYSHLTPIVFQVTI